MHYKLKADPDVFDCLALRDPDKWSIFQEFVGETVPNLPSSIEAEIYQVGRPGDYPYLANNVAVFSKRAWSVLKPLVADFAQVLTLKTETEQYCAANVFTIQNALDLEASTVTRSESGMIRTIKKYSFRPGSLEGRAIFKVRESAVVDVLVSEVFKSTVERNALLGFVFVPVE